MAVFRIERNRDYTVMSNHHLRDTGLSLKSKGLLSMMLSLPEEWNYTTRGLAAICKEGADCIGSALRELEQAGYIVRNRIRDSKGKIVDVEYIIYETPHKPQSAPPEPERPDTENPDMDIPCPEMTAQLNKDVCLDGVLNCLRFCLGFLDQPLQLSKLLTFHFQFVDAHGFLLSWWWMVVKIVSEPFPPRVAGGFSDKLHWVGCLYLRG